MTDALIGQHFGGYEILGLIGQGGMATVYRARQLSMGRIVALKVLPRQFIDDATTMQRFHREVAIVARLEHRGVVPVYDHGEQDGQPYIVMRYLGGGSIDDWLARERFLPPATILRVLEAVAPALDYAHQQGVLHRDLKPSNVLLDDQGAAYLTDFGIARTMGEQSVSLTTQGVIGTPSYMSPEQAQGQPLDARSDLYSLGVMLFEMATGKRPFESETPYSIAVLHVTAAPPPPRQLKPDLSAPIESVILTAMSKPREHRYPSAAAMLEAWRQAVHAPAASMVETQPRIAIPRNAPPPPTPNEFARPPNTPAPYPTPPVYTPTPRPLTASAPPARRRANCLSSALIGVILGIILLLLLGIAAIAVIGGSAAQQRQAERTRTAQALTAIVSPAEANAATPGPEVAFDLLPDAPTMTPAAALPIGERETPTPAVREASSRLVYFAERGGNFDLFLLDLATGNETTIAPSPGADLYPAVSPDGSRLAFVSDRSGNLEIYVADLDGGNIIRITENNVTDRTPSWSRDGAWLAFASETGGAGHFDLYRVRADSSELSLIYEDGGINTAPVWESETAIVFAGGRRRDGSDWEIRRLNLETGDAEAITFNRAKDTSPAIAPDGRIVYVTEGAGYGAIAHMNADGTDNAIVYDGEGYDWAVAVSPDGRIAFTSDESVSDAIYLLDDDGVRAITPDGGMGAAWVP